MDKPNFNQDWYGMQAKVLSQSDDCVVVDYGCNGRGTVMRVNLPKHFNLYMECCQKTTEKIDRKNGLFYLPF